jgi:hypothetical protein
MLISFEDNITNANTVLSCVIGALNKDGVLSDSQAQDILSNYAVIILKPSWFSSVLSKLMGKNGWKYQVVKVISTITTNKDV